MTKPTLVFRMDTDEEVWELRVLQAGGCGAHRQLLGQSIVPAHGHRHAGPSMDQITTPNPKCRLYWCLMKIRDWRYSQSGWYFRPLLWASAPLPSLKFTSPPLPCVKKYRSIQSLQCVTGGGDPVVWRASTRLIHCVFDQIQNKQNCFTTPSKQNCFTTPSKQNCFTTPNKNLGEKGPQTDKHMLPKSHHRSIFCRKADIEGLVSLKLFGPSIHSFVGFFALKPRAITRLYP